MESMSPRAVRLGQLAVGSCRDVLGEHLLQGYDGDQMATLNLALAFALWEIDNEVIVMRLCECQYQGGQPEATGQEFTVAMVDDMWIDAAGAHYKEDYRHARLMEYPEKSQLRAFPNTYGLLARPTISNPGPTRLNVGLSSSLRCAMRAIIEQAQMQQSTPSGQVCIPRSRI